MIIYRKIYEQHFGPIPKDDDGRTYEIHHIDGDSSNNHPSNLKAVSIKEHYDIHYSQRDWAACLLISERLKLSPEEISAISSKRVQKMLEKKTHPFLGGDLQRMTMKKLVEEGTHNFLGGDIQREHNRRRVENGSHHLLRENSPQIQNGTHHFFGGEIQRNSNLKRLSEGTHPSQVEWKCEHCGKEGKNKTNYIRHHGDKCRKHHPNLYTE